jgi:dienelactone hydrolase
MRRFLVLALIAIPVFAVAKVVTKTVLYHEGKTVLEGFMAYDDSKGKRPCVLIVHDWDGLGDYEKMRAKQIASLGYTALAVDIYGRGVRPKPPQAAGAESGKYAKDRMLTRRRIGMAMRYASGQPQVDRKRIAVMGYCFGGMVALELGRAGNPVKGIVSFHGNLSNPNPSDAKDIKGQVLILHGAADPFVPKAQVAAFEKEMKAAKRPYRIVVYPGAVHAFTVKEAGNNPKSGAAYNASADKKSWAEMSSFFKRVLK